MNREQVEEFFLNFEAPILFADGFDEAIIGVARQFNTYCVAYDREKCIGILMEDMNFFDAEEYFEFNVVGSYVGPNGPTFIIKESG
ncbi:MAG TPA: hypothetical protein DCL80_07730 [Balneola sp.]|nr:hypothetical protein [Balneola sp.]